MHSETEQRAYRLGWLRAKNPNGWDEQDDITSGDAIFDSQMFDDLGSDYPCDAATPPASDAAVPARPVTRMEVIREWVGGERYARDYEYCDASFKDQADRVLALFAAAPKVASEATMPFGLPLSDTDLTRLYEGSKRDALPVGSEVRQLVAEVRYHRGNSIPVAYLLTKAGSFEEFSRSPLTDADKADGWTETQLYVRSGHSL